jgi:hypothetical protein
VRAVARAVHRHRAAVAGKVAAAAGRYHKAVKQSVILLFRIKFMRPTIPIAAFKRVPLVYSTFIAGVDLTAAAFFCHIRQRFGDNGLPIITLSNAAAGAQGVSATYIPALTYYDCYSRKDITVPATVITLRIDEATLEAVPLANPTNQPLQLVYDVHNTPTGADKYVAYGGDFYLFPGSTI